MEFPRLRRSIQALSVHVRAWLLRKGRRIADKGKIDPSTKKAAGAQKEYEDEENLGSGITGAVMDIMTGHTHETHHMKTIDTATAEEYATGDFKSAERHMHYEPSSTSSEASATASPSVQTGSATTDVTTVSSQTRSPLRDGHYEPSVSTTLGADEERDQGEEFEAGSDEDEDAVSFRS